MIGNGVNNISKTQKKKAEGNVRTKKRILVRIYFVAFICFAGFLVVLARAVYLHLSDNKELKWIADKQYNARIPLSLRRGKIYDRNGSELAVSLPVPSIYADPVLVENPEEVAAKLAGILELNQRELLASLKTSRRFVWIKRRISYDALEKVLSLNLSGVSFIEESRRFYPNGELASQVLGAVGFDSQALAGIELKYDKMLISQKKATSYKRDARGKLYATPLGFGEQSDVGEVYLTIDKQVQFFAESELRKAVSEHEARDGVAIVMDAETGDILAMANSPVFDPNRYSKYPVASWRNRVVTDAFEPGSTFKVLVVAAALDGGVAKPETVYDCEGGAYKIGNDVLKDHHPYNKLSVQDIIKVSSNIGAMKIGFDLGKKGLYEVLKDFGIGSATDIDFPGEVSGVLRNYKSWQTVEHATVAFGQGLTVTPIQLVAAFTAAINGGNYRKPKLVARIMDKDGKISMSEQSEILAHPIKKETSETLRHMLRRVVEEGGTGTKANSEAYAIGGKTGTAQKVAPGGKGYAKGRYFSSFIGFAPVEDPKVVVFVGLDEPKGSYYGGTVAAPAVKTIIENSLNYLGVPSTKSPVLYTADSGSINVNEENSEEKKYEPEMTKTEFVKESSGKYVMPDLTGLTIREVLSVTGNKGFEVETSGSGIAVNQEPAPGSLVDKERKFSVRFELPR